MKRRWPPNFDDQDTKPRFRKWVVLIPVFILIFILVVILRPDRNNNKSRLPANQAATSTPTFQTSPSPSPTSTNTPRPTFTPGPEIAPTSDQETTGFPNGVIILSLADGYYRHLFAYHPSDLPLTRLTNHPWDDVDPAISPDGTRLAYSSRRNGFWDIYIFDFRSGESTRVTDTLHYDGHPTWAPDGNWLAFESYYDENLEIFIQSLSDLSAPAMRLTHDPAADCAPAWSPLGNEIAFSTQRTGDLEIYTISVNTEERNLNNKSSNPDSQDTSPSWSLDGQTLGWTSTQGGISKISLTRVAESGSEVDYSLPGTNLLWRPDGTGVLSIISQPNSVSIAGFDPSTTQLTVPAIAMDSKIFGWDWRAGDFGALVTPYLQSENGRVLKLDQTSPTAYSIDPVTGRPGLVRLNNVSVSNPMLSDSVDELFTGLRMEAARISGWDVLENLEKAYLPLTDPSNPGLIDQWLVTGLGFAINTLPMQAGWMVVQKEDFNGEVFWRLYLRARYQDGSQGEPLNFPVWDLLARSSGNAAHYEDGGSLQPVPAGYWIDLTELAERFGWQRLPALSNWRTYFSAARFNQFAVTRGMDWQTAMLELFPPELVQRPTRMPTITSTPTSTPFPNNSRTATAQAGGLLLNPTNPGIRPTWTPVPEEGYP